jgi:hypothetical protein
MVRLSGVVGSGWTDKEHYIGRLPCSRSSPPKIERLWSESSENLREHSICGASRQLKKWRPNITLVAVFVKSYRVERRVLPAFTAHKVGDNGRKFNENRE